MLVDSIVCLQKKKEKRKKQVESVKCSIEVMMHRSVSNELWLVSLFWCLIYATDY